MKSGVRGEAVAGQVCRKTKISEGVEMAVKVLGIDHVVLVVADMDRAIQFYCGVLGCKEERRVSEINLVQLRAGRSLIDLVTSVEPVREGGANMDHFALRLEVFDETTLRDFLSTHGIDPGDVKRRYGAEGDGPSMYIRDPDGNTVELKGPPGSKLKEDDQ
jgi:catechol 2,3-dioxygenase-like lactoylglutathione lyase family enzyme